eukprot:TRINITY_DN526_c1_g2_i1.p1 TRINITY_DN526_c1_g2~~TRINITY_DN526_c1_g2_i1.p1  ORF type:complete len:767 (+),score=190.52 TRINITY_DN526_c1_g2_i1:211-2511(+)
MSAAAAMLRSESLMDLLASDDDDDFGLGDSDDDDDIDAFIAKNTMGGKKKEEKEEAKPEPKPDPTPAEKPVEKPAPEPTAPKEDSKAKEEAEKKAKEEAEAKIRAEAEAKVRAEMEAKAKAEAEAKAKAEMEAKIRAEAEAKVKAEMEAEQKKKAEEEEEKKKRQEEADQAAADKKAKEEEEKKKKEEEKANAAAAKKKKEEEAAAAKKKSAARPSSAHVSRRDSVSSARGNNARPQSAGSRASAGSRLRSGSVASSRSHGASTTATVARPTNANGKSKGAAASQSSLGADADAGVVEDDGESDEAHEHGYDDDEHPDDGDGHQNDEDVELSASLSHRRRKSGLSIATDVERVGAGPESPGGGRLTPKALRQFLAEAAPAEARPKPIISHRVVTKAATDTRTPVSMTRKAKQERARSIRDGNESHPQYKTFMFPDTLHRRVHSSRGSPLLDLLQQEEALRQTRSDGDIAASASGGNGAGRIQVYTSQSPTAVMLSPRSNASRTSSSSHLPAHGKHNARLSKKRQQTKGLGGTADSLRRQALQRQSMSQSGSPSVTGKSGGRRPQSAQPSRRPYSLSPRARRVQSQQAGELAHPYGTHRGPASVSSHVSLHSQELDESKMLKFHNTLKYLMRLWEQLSFPEDDRLEFIAEFGEATRTNAEHLLAEVSRMQALRREVAGILELVEEREVLLQRIKNVVPRSQQSNQLKPLIERFLLRSQNIEMAIEKLKHQAKWISLFLWRNQDYSEKMIRDAAELRRLHPSQSFDVR